MSNQVWQKFWVVWCPVSGPPSVFHKSFTEAANEAKRLALKEPERIFYVLSPVNSYRTRDVDVTWYIDENSQA